MFTKGVSAPANQAHRVNRGDTNEAEEIRNTPSLKKEKKKEIANGDIDNTLPNTALTQAAPTIESKERQRRTKSTTGAPVAQILGEKLDTTDFKSDRITL